MNSAGYLMMSNFMISRRIRQAEDVIMTRGENIDSEDHEEYGITLRSTHVVSCLHVFAGILLPES